MTISKLQQAVQYNKVHLPRTAAGLAALQPDVSTDLEFRHKLRCELADLLQQLDSCTHRIYGGAASNALFELATENWAKFQLRPNWSVIAYRLGPDLWLIPMAENKIAFWSTREHSGSR